MAKKKMIKKRHSDIEQETLQKYLDETRHVEEETSTFKNNTRLPKNITPSSGKENLMRKCCVLVEPLRCYPIIEKKIDVTAVYRNSSLTNNNWVTNIGDIEKDAGPIEHDYKHDTYTNIGIVREGSLSDISQILNLPHGVLVEVLTEDETPADDDRSSLLNNDDLDASSVNSRRNSSEKFGVKQFACAKCGKCFTSKSCVTRHELLHNSSKPYSCKECGKDFSTRHYLTKHMSTDHTVHQCSRGKCKKCLNVKDVSSQPLSHNGPIRVNCPKCGNSFSKKSHLNRHMLIHSGIKPFTCGECRKDFTRRNSLNKHMLIHSKEKQFSCSVCKKRFTEKGNLTAHMLIHSGVRQFVCATCGKCFRLKGDLTKHMFVHSGIKPFFCALCGKCFPRKSTLKRHMFSHNEVKPFICPECGQDFTRKTLLRTHQLLRCAKK